MLLEELHIQGQDLSDIFTIVCVISKFIQKHNKYYLVICVKQHTHSLSCSNDDVLIAVLYKFLLYHKDYR